MTIRELCEKEVVQLEQGVCLGRADDLELDPATAQLQSLILLGRPRLFGLLGRFFFRQLAERHVGAHAHLASHLLHQIPHERTPGKHRTLVDSL